MKMYGTTKKKKSKGSVTDRELSLLKKAYGKQKTGYKTKKKKSKPKGK